MTTDWPIWKTRLGLVPDQDKGLKPQPNDEEDLDFEDQDPLDEDGDDLDPDLDEQREQTPQRGQLDDPLEWETSVIPFPTKVALPPCNARDFNSWSEFVESTTDESLVGWKGRRASRDESDKNQKSNPWSGTATWQQAVDMATRTGWPEGRKLLSEMLVAISPRPEPYRTLEYSVAGAFPMVPNYCAGDPECMVIDPGSDLRHAKPIIRIDYNHWVSAYVTPKDMMLRGAAIISLADSLERTGFSVELRIVGNSRSHYSSKEFRYSIVYKRAGEILDLDRAAFAIAHPSSMRRLAFAILEQHYECEQAFSVGYGQPMYESNDKSSDAIFVPGSRGGETPESAKAAVEKAAERLLTEIQENREVGD
jgi:hypothetical protein